MLTEIIRNVFMAKIETNFNNKYTIVMNYCNFLIKAVELMTS